jgi:hypothetical protein
MLQTTPRTKLQGRKMRPLWVDANTLTTTLVAMFVDTYGTEGFSWDPETIALELQDDFNVDLPAPNFSRLMTGIKLLTTDEFYQNLRDFIEYCNIMSGSIAGTFDPADVDEIAWGITEAMLLAPPDDDDEEPFHPEVLAYIGEMTKREGLINPPDILRIGTRNDDALSRVQAGFTDDPTMFGAIFEIEQGQTDEINEMVKGRLRMLVQQLESLDLKNGDTADIAKSFARVLK